MDGKGTIYVYGNLFMLCVRNQQVSVILRLTEHWGDLFMWCVSGQPVSAENVSSILRWMVRALFMVTCLCCVRNQPVSVILRLTVWALG